MPTLRINQHPGSAENRCRIEVSTEGIPGFQPQGLTTEIAFALSPQDRERIRWYLEDFLEFDQDPAPQIAKRVEVLMADCGERLFRGIFESSPASIKLWAAIEPYLSSTRVEITTGIAEATALPWELVRDPNTKTTLALSVQAFVRTQRGAQQALAPQQAESEKVRILLVICRPGGGEDVPFRSVAGRLVTRLSGAAREAFDLDVLRPPTYEQLATMLRLAKEAGRPYHIVHFDGHGVYADPADLASTGKVLSSLKLDGATTGAHGFLMFEDPDSKTHSEFVDGFKLGTLLRDSGVPLLLNACQSAFAEATAEPKQAPAQDAREELQAYGSLAQAVVEAGAAGVVAMRYSVYVVTAAQFVAELYGALARGRTLGEAVTWARKNLADRPERRIAFEPRPLQDWSVPVVWERAPLRLWPDKPDATPIRITLDEGAAAKPGALDRALPARPDVGFYGRDETLYALDRAFDTHRIVLLHAYAGSGKTATAAEFARWYALTGGVEGPVLFTSFERYLPLARVLDKIGEVFGHALAATGVQWDAITDAVVRADVALQVLQQVPVLWIWDNVEPVAGFPAGTQSDWSTEEQHKLRAFLSAARDSKAKFLLTSRRDEQAWLGDLPRRVPMPPMPMQERLQLAGAIAEHRGKRLADLPDLRPLLCFTQGNPLTILVTVGQALRTGIDIQERLEDYVEKLRAGGAVFTDEGSEDREKSLAASLSYGFEHAFNDEERKILALLHLFQGFVAADIFCLMGNPVVDRSMEEIRGLTVPQCIALFDRAAEIGMLTKVKLNPSSYGLYSIHPALPWFFRTLFETYYPAITGDNRRAEEAFIETMAAMGGLLNYTHNYGNREWAWTVVAAEEQNLLAAWRLARVRGRGDLIVRLMPSLQILYESTKRRPAFRRLIETILPDFVDLATDKPLAGSEEGWSQITAYRVQWARDEGRLAHAERLERLLLEWFRARAQPSFDRPPDDWTSQNRYYVRSVTMCLKELGDIQRELEEAACVDVLQEALDLAQRLNDRLLAATCARELGVAYLLLPATRDLDVAERYFRQSFDLYDPQDTIGRGGALSHLGMVAHARFKEAHKALRPPAELEMYFKTAVDLLQLAQELLPQNATYDRAISCNTLGVVYMDRGHLELARKEFEKAIRLFEQDGRIHRAGGARFNVALTFVRAGWLNEALAYAEAAVDNFRSFGSVAEVQNTEKLIAEIKQFVQKVGSQTP